MSPTPCERAKSRIAATGSAALQAHDLRAELARHLDVREQVALRLRVDAVGRLAGRLDVDHEPIGVEPPGHARAAAQQRLRRAADTTTCTPSRARRRLAGARARPSVCAWPAPRVRALSATSRSASSRSVDRFSVLEEVRERPRDLVGGVDLAGPQPLEQVLDREVEVHDLVGLLEEACRARVSRTTTPVARSTRSFRLSRCWMLRAPITLMPASSSSSTSW